MGISENLSLLNWERYKSWSLPFDPESSRQAAFTFMGDTYVGLGSHSLSDVELKISQDNTRILSGLYGILRPMDLIMPYRLEMGTKLKIEGGTYIHDFWSTPVTEFLNKELKSHNNKIIIN